MFFFWEIFLFEDFSPSVFPALKLSMPYRFFLVTSSEPVITCVAIFCTTMLLSHISLDRQYSSWGLISAAESKKHLAVYAHVYVSHYDDCPFGTVWHFLMFSDAAIQIDTKEIFESQITQKNMINSSQFSVHRQGTFSFWGLFYVVAKVTSGLIIPSCS